MFYIKCFILQRFGLNSTKGEIISLSQNSRNTIPWEWIDSLE